MKILYSTHQSFKFNNRCLRSAVDGRGVTWFCYEDLFDLFSVSDQDRNIRFKQLKQHELTLSKIDSKNYIYYVNEAEAIMVILNFGGDDANSLMDKLFKEVIRPVRKRISLVDGGLVA